MKRLIVWLLLALTVASASAQKMNVAAAANLRDVLEEIKVAYLKTRPKAQITLIFGSSGTLVQQITNGASFDLFMSADNEFPLKLKEKGLTIGAMTTYAFGKLALYSTTIDVEKKGLDALKDASVKKIALANPTSAPYGERAQALALELSAGVEVSLKKSAFTNLSRCVEEASGRANAASKPVTGSMVLTHESGIHAHCLLRDRSAYQLIPAALIGREEVDFCIGKHSGKAVLRQALDRLGLECSELQLADLLERVRQRSNDLKHSLSSEEILALYYQILQTQATPLCIPRYYPTKK